MNKGRWHVVVPIKLTVGHVPLEVSRLYHYFLANGGTICGIVDDTRPRRSPIPSGGLEIKLKLKFQAPAKLADKMKVFIRNAYMTTTSMRLMLMAMMLMKKMKIMTFDM